jgi:hypothetical protein
MPRNWRVVDRSGYGRDMSVDEATNVDLSLKTFAAWAGSWVAIKAGTVIASASTLPELMAALRTLRSKADRATIVYIPDDLGEAPTTHHLGIVAG